MSSIFQNQRAQDRSNQSILAGILMVVVMLASMSVVFDLVVGDHRSMNFTTTSLSALALLAFCLACTVYASMSTSITLPEVLVVYFITVSAAFSGFYEITTDFFPWPKVHSDIEMSYVAFLYFLFLFLFLAGHLIANWRPSSPTKAVVIDTKFRFILLATVTLSVLCITRTAGMGRQTLRFSR
ncbi:hypothetical protein [Rhizobium gallicum]|uniref:hypothetical protein n=1 Tax=Rhizobium gallicum TaxID=56730 RepID=UPI00093ABAD6|nr:hypothetical protein [Rhizobium gallicum]